MAKEKSSVQFYYEYIEQLEDLNDKQFKEVVEAMVEYDKTGKHKQLDIISNMAFKFIKKRIDYDKERYLSICERNKLNGSKGGRPKTQENPKEPSGLFGNPKKPKKPDIDIDIDLDIDIDNNNNSCSCFLDLAQQEFLNITPMQYEQLIDLENKYGTEMCIEALKICSNNNKKTINYLKGVLKNYGTFDKKKSPTPEWLGKDIKSEEMNSQEINEMEELFREFN